MVLFIPGPKCVSLLAYELLSALFAINILLSLKWLHLHQNSEVYFMIQVRIIKLGLFKLGLILLLFCGSLSQHQTVFMNKNLHFLVSLCLCSSELAFYFKCVHLQCFDTFIWILKAINWFIHTHPIELHIWCIKLVWNWHLFHMSFMPNWRQNSSSLDREYGGQNNALQQKGVHILITQIYAYFRSYGEAGLSFR